MLNECISCREQHELNVFGTCEQCWWNRLTPGERVLAWSLHGIRIVQDGQETMGIEIAQLKKAVEGLTRMLKTPSEELDEAIGQWKRLMRCMESRMKRDENDNDDGNEWRNNLDDDDP